MGKYDYSNIIEILINEKKYEELCSYLKELFLSSDIKVIKNIIQYKEVLLNPKGDCMKTKQLIEPIKKYIKENIKDESIHAYIICCDQINKQYVKINNYLKQQFDELYKFNFEIALMTLASKVEKINHNIINSLQKEEDDLTSRDINNNYLVEYQNNIEGFNIILREINEHKESFRKSKSFKDKDMLFSSLKRCDKKAFKIKELRGLLLSIVEINQLCKEIKDNNFRIDKIDKDIVVMEYVDLDDYNKKNIAGIRCKIFDTNLEWEYKKEIHPKSMSLLEKVGGCNFNNLIDIDTKHNHCSLKIDFHSKEFRNILINEYLEFSYQTELMLENSFAYEELDKKIKVKENELCFTYKDSIDFYFILKVIAALQHQATCFYYELKGLYPTLPILGLDNDVAYEIIRNMYKILHDTDISEDKINKLIEFYTFSNNNIYDLYYKPLFFIGKKIIILPSLFRFNNFGRTFLTHMNIIEANFKEGLLYEKYIKRTFQDNGFIVYDKESPKLNFRLENGESGDIDFLSIKGKYIFYSQLKNRTTPIEENDYVAFNRKINKKAIKQLKSAKEFLLSNPRYVTEFFGVDKLEDFQFVPFIITNSFFSSGDQRSGVFLIDTSAINTFFDKGAINIFYKDKKIYHKDLRTGNIEEDFYDLLNNPYFNDLRLYDNLYIPKRYEILDKNFILKVNDQVIKEHGRTCYMKNYSSFCKYINNTQVES